MIHRNWWFYKHRFRVREALLRQQISSQMLAWQKMLMPPNGKSLLALLLKEDRAEMKLMYQKISDSEIILQRYLTLFSEMIKYETMTRNIYHRIETERSEATRTL